MMELLNFTEVYAARIKDKEILQNSSSGGMFTVLSDVFLTEGNAVVCCVYNCKNSKVEYRLILSKSERDKARGSKYVQSILGDIHNEAVRWLKENPLKSLLFIGMGCQATGFHSFIQEKGLRERVCIIDIICHGSPSPMLLEDYCKMLEHIYKGSIDFITFKDKRKGWKYPTAIAKINGKEISIKEYSCIFYNKCALRPSCHKCPYASTKRYTDVTIGDFWHIEEKLPDFYNPMGNSLVLIHTKKGKQLFDNIKCNIDYCESNTQDCWQINLERPTEISKDRDRFWIDYCNHGITYIIRKYGKVSIFRRIKDKIDRIVQGGE